MLDKPAGLSSHSCVSRVRRAYGLKRVGHGGTLDPAVTGVLPIALGPATRLLPYLCGNKTYRGVVQLGLRTSSDDLEAGFRNADLVILGTEWAEYKAIEPKAFGDLVANKLIIDGRNVLDVASWQAAGWRLIALGRNVHN